MQHMLLPKQFNSQLYNKWFKINKIAFAVCPPWQRIADLEYTQHAPNDSICICSGMFARRLLVTPITLDHRLNDEVVAHVKPPSPPSLLLPPQDLTLLLILQHREKLQSKSISLFYITLLYCTAFEFFRLSCLSPQIAYCK